MPKDHKKRGRRGDKKRKLEQEDEEHSPKRSKLNNEALDYLPLEGDDSHQNGHMDDAAATAYRLPGEMPFYGMLDEEEQEYFKRADEMLELNQFADPEDRSTFLANVYKEAEGKELKLANSQSCSRLMERLIILSIPNQLKSLFHIFSEHFLHLVQHRFASHCCEALFIKGASVVTAELFAQSSKNTNSNQSDISMEDLYLRTIQELEQNLGFLLTDKFASHTLRVLLVVLSGQPLAHSATKSVVQSKRKEHVSVAITEKQPELSLDQRTVPDSFITALGNVINKCMSGFDTTYLRALANHPTGNPTIQLLLQLELTQFGKQKAKDDNSIIHKLLPEDPITEENDSGKFINGMIYDPVGSRLLETIIEHAPGKMFKSIYRQLFKQKLGTLARNDTASYVVSKLLCRLSKDDLADAVETFCPAIPTLVERNRTAVIKTLTERCAIRGVDTTPIAIALDQAYGGPGHFEVMQLLKINKTEHSDSSSQGNKEASISKTQTSQAEKLHGSLLAQAMIAIPGPLSALIYDSLAQLGTALSISLAKDPSASHTIQAALTAPTASVIFRRKMIQQFYGHIGEMALDPSASHVIDAIWKGTHGLAFIRERIAEELAENEASLRESFVGRAVWRNWNMDLYKRKRKEWVLASRNSAGNDSFIGFPEEGKGEREKENTGGSGPGGRQLSNIENARMKHFKEKVEKEKRMQEKEKRAGKAKLKTKDVKTGANALTARDA